MRRPPPFLITTLDHHTPLTAHTTDSAVSADSASPPVARTTALCAGTASRLMWATAALAVLWSVVFWALD